MKRMTTTAIALSLATAGAVSAQEQDSDTLTETTQEAASSAANHAEQAVDATTNVAEDAVDATQSAANNAASETEQAVESTANAAATAVERLSNTVTEATSAAGEELRETVAELRDTMVTSGMVTMEGTEVIRASEFIGSNFYSMADTPADWSADSSYSSVDENWTRVGDVSDLLMSEDGQIQGMIAEIGGFMGINSKHIVISLEDANRVVTDDGTFAFVTPMDKAALDSMASIDAGLLN